MNIAQMVAGDPYTWQKQHAQMSPAELYAFGDELAATIKHPSTQNMLDWQVNASARLAAIRAEYERRWRGVWHTPDNRDLSELLGKISELAA